jgi:ABC-type lipoprotein release transport system permease subunit
MDPTVISAILALVGSLVGTFAGIITSSKLTEYRIKELEKKQDKHNAVIERTYRLEERMELVEERQKVANHRISDLEGKRNGQG